MDGMAGWIGRQGGRGGTVTKKHQPEAEAAFVMGGEDRFHAIAVSDPIRFEMEPEAESVITFFFIRRGNGSCDAVNVNRIFDRGRCVSRTIQTKTGVPERRIREEPAATLRVFADGIERETGYRIKWNTLDLSAVEDRSRQIVRIRAWGRVGVRTEAELYFPGMN